jgi:hypothetical protein
LVFAAGAPPNYNPAREFVKRPAGPLARSNLMRALLASLEGLWQQDGSFTVTNSRNGFTKTYRAESGS